MAPGEGEHSDNKPSLPDCGDAIDANTFEQILEMDDDDGRDFSRELVFGFFEQSSQTLESMDDALKAGELDRLSELGHYLKGSSATLGLTKVRDHCEKIQHLGSGKNETGETVAWDTPKSLEKIRNIMSQLKSDCAEVERRLRHFYENFPSS